ncbi:uncharacterized protein IL334_004142 [Kwoniella shivajii]|uniref:Trehalase n=1 Tax=Kwoniella shivajii TaxID=564305 RepID=A0ABZ1D2J1_9TREE|nr:hypothetical protein IL334_004142 [Kwoniella shivajii]
MTDFQANKATNLLFIDHDVPSSTAASASTTPTDPSVADPLAAMGAGIKPPPPQTNGTVSPPVPPPFSRLGKLANVETKLPDVHSEPHEYYGGAEAGVAGTTKRRPPQMGGENISRNRRLSHASSNAHKTFDIRGTYMLSNLLQELALARDYGRKRIVLDEARLAENPVDRLSRMIKNSFWNALTRRIDAEGLEVACADPKNRSQHSKARIYIPHGEEEMAAHYREILNDKPGILALAMDRKVDANGKVKLEALPFIVPGARFNEKYGWDSYLARSQPPFLTDLALQIYNQLDRSQKEENKSWLKRVIQAAIKEYHSYWMSTPSIDPISGLSRYRPAGLGIPPETEATHFTHILQPFAQKLGISVNEYIEGYNNFSIQEPELDEYFLHDRGYEMDIGSAIEVAFDGELELEEEFPLSPWPVTPEAFEPGAHRDISTSVTQTAAHWKERAYKRIEIMDEYCWNEGHGMYFDYDTKAKKQARYESVTTLWPLWAGCASEHQALRLVNSALPKFEVAGGLVSGTEESRGIISLDRPNRQWDYPYAWPPHQIMAWVGLERYGFLDDAARLAYRWIYMMTLSFVDFNGIVPEKFDAVELSHMVDAEYLPVDVSAAYQIGLQCLSTGMRRAVANCVPPWVFFNLSAPDFSSARKRRAEREAREAEAAASGHGGAPKLEVHFDPPSLEEAVAQLKLELGPK